jgi:hypothetical protein
MFAAFAERLLVVEFRGARSRRDACFTGDMGRFRTEVAGLALERNFPLAKTTLRAAICDDRLYASAGMDGAYTLINRVLYITHCSHLHDSVSL